jgi:PiT family inorganic phosphate transporter
VATGSISGAGAASASPRCAGASPGSWRFAWALTLPAAAAVGGLAAWVAGTGTVGTVLVSLVALSAGAGDLRAVAPRLRRPHDVNETAVGPPSPSLAPALRRSATCTSTGTAFGEVLLVSFGTAVG